MLLKRQTFVECLITCQSQKKHISEIGLEFMVFLAFMICLYVMFIEGDTCTSVY